MSSLSLHTGTKLHTLLAIIIALWLVIFLVFIAPFDASDVPLHIRLHLMPPYGLIFLGCYMMVVWVQNRLFNYLKRWNWGLEIALMLFLFLFMLPFLFAYYKTDIVKGTFTFLEFSLTVYLPILLIISPILLFGRWMLTRFTKPIEQPIRPAKLLLKGDNKNDFLQLDMASLIAISSAQNYVEVYYLQNEKLQKQLLRTTLKKVHEDAPNLVRIHRSHLINSAHLVKWTSLNSVLVHQIHLPVSQSYKKEVEGLL